MRYHIGIQFKTLDGMRVLIHPGYILDVIELDAKKVQITTDRWLKVFDASYDDVMNGIDEWENAKKMFETQPYMDMVESLLKTVEKKHKEDNPNT